MLRGSLSAAAALLVLVGWQWLAGQAEVADVNHFLWKGQYNYSRGVGAAALWLMLALMIYPGRTRVGWWLQTLTAIALAAGALACHVAPGGLAFGTLALWFGLVFLRKPGARPFVGGCLTVAALAGMVLGTGVWRAMASAAGGDGWQPMPWIFLLLLTTPSAVGAAVWLVWRVRSRAAAETADGASVADWLACALVVATVFQSYLLTRLVWNASVAPYAVKSVLFYTTAFAALFWVNRLCAWWCRRPRAAPDGTRVSWAWPSPLQAIAATAAVGAGLVTMLKTDVLRPTFGPLRDPGTAACRLAEHRAELAGYFYWDPEQPFGSWFVNRAGFGQSFPSCGYFDLISNRAAVAQLIAQGEIKGLVLPPGVAPSLVDDWPSRCACYPMGPFCRWEMTGPASPPADRQHEGVGPPQEVSISGEDL